MTLNIILIRNLVENIINFITQNLKGNEIQIKFNEKNF